MAIPCARHLAAYAYAMAVASALTKVGAHAPYLRRLDDAVSIRTSTSIITKLTDSVGTPLAILILVLLAAIAVILGALLARKFLRKQEEVKPMPDVPDSDNLMKLVGLDGVTPGPRIASTDLSVQTVVGKVGSCIIFQAERLSAQMQQSRFFDFKLSGFSRMHPADLVLVKKIVPEHGAQDDPLLRAFVEEIDLMARLDHPKIIQFVGISWNTLKDVSMVQEYLSNGTLASLLAMDKQREQAGNPRQLDWFETRESKIALPALPSKASLAMDIIEAIAYLHSLDPPVLHRALTSENVLLSHEFEAKLAHFLAPSHKTAEIAGTASQYTVAWLAPEVLCGEPFTTKSDMYAFGIILSELATHTRPFDGVATASIVMQVTTDHAHPSITDADCPDFIRDLAERCMSANPQDRPTAAMVLPELLFRINRAKVAPASSETETGSAAGSTAAAVAPANVPPTGNASATPAPAAAGAEQPAENKPKVNWLTPDLGFFRR